MRVSVAEARAPGEVLECQYLIADVYNRDYGVVFSADRYDLDEKIEPWPHRYLSVRREGQLVSAIGLYMRDTYVERFGQVSAARLGAVLGERPSAPGLREVTKLVVPPARRGEGLALFTLGAAHSRAFCGAGAALPPPLVCCAKRSIVTGLYGRLGITLRHLHPFPHYRVHERYRSEADPMDSWLSVPELDIPKRWYELELPGEYEIAALVEGLT